MNLALVIVTRVIGSRRFRFANEKDLQAGIETALLEEGIRFEREVKLAKGDIIDFIVDDLGIEVKIDGPLTALTRQLARYARHERIAELLVVSSRNGLTNLPTSLGGKRLTTISLAGAML